MKPLPPEPPTAFTVLVRVVPQPLGQFTATVVGIPEVQVTADSRDDAIKRLRLTLSGLAQSGELVSVAVPASNPLMRWCGWAKDDPDYGAFLEELRLQREEFNKPECEETEAPCSDTSSTPTT